ncbi:thioesterase domain-containing protein [Colletotrichum cereale]|nr:thioesterase domain-containing protein [Colletotrichum cereale]
MAHLLAEEGRGLVCAGLVLVDTVYLSPARSLGSGANSNLKTTAPAMPPDMAPGTRDEILASLVRANVLCSSWRPPLWDRRRMPRTVLVRATDSIPLAAPRGSGDGAGTDGVDDGMSRLDVLRDRADLGWGEMQPGLVTAVVNTPGHHYALFADENIHSTTESLKLALSQLEIDDQ